MAKVIPLPRHGRQENLLFRNREGLWAFTAQGDPNTGRHQFAMNSVMIVDAQAHRACRTSH